MAAVVHRLCRHEEDGTFFTTVDPLPHRPCALSTVGFLFIHGKTSSSATFRSVAESMFSTVATATQEGANTDEAAPEQRRGGTSICLLVDLPGHGAASLPQNGVVTEDNFVSFFSNAAFADAVANAVAAMFGMDDIRSAHHLAFHVVGHSLGTRVAAELAARFPALVKTLTLEDPVPFDAPGRPAVDCALVFSHALQKQANVDRVSCTSLDEASHLFASLLHWEPAGARRKLMQNHDGTVTLMFSVFVSELWATVSKSQDVTRALVQVITQPILIVLADDRESAFPSSAWNQWIASQPELHRRMELGAIRVVRVAGAAHTIHRSHETDFLRLLSTFVRPCIPKDAFRNA